jgi:hypothetical protein
MDPVLVQAMMTKLRQRFQPLLPPRMDRSQEATVTVSSMPLPATSISLPLPTPVKSHDPPRMSVPVASTKQRYASHLNSSPMLADLFGEGQDLLSYRPSVLLQSTLTKTTQHSLSRLAPLVQVDGGNGKPTNGKPLQAIINANASVPMEIDRNDKKDVFTSIASTTMAATHTTTTTTTTTTSRSRKRKRSSRKSNCAQDSISRFVQNSKSSSTSQGYFSSGVERIEITLNWWERLQHWFQQWREGEVFKKIVLLSGPSGSGKTFAIHHCGPKWFPNMQIVSLDPFFISPAPSLVEQVQGAQVRYRGQPLLFHLDYVHPEDKGLNASDWLRFTELFLKSSVSQCPTLILECRTEDLYGHYHSKLTEWRKHPNVEVINTSKWSSNKMTDLILQFCELHPSISLSASLWARILSSAHGNVRSLLNELEMRLTCNQWQTDASEEYKHPNSFVGQISCNTSMVECLRLLLTKSHMLRGWKDRLHRFKLGSTTSMFDSLFALFHSNSQLDWVGYRLLDIVLFLHTRHHTSLSPIPKPSPSKRAALAAADELDAIAEGYEAVTTMDMMGMTRNTYHDPWHSSLSREMRTVLETVLTCDILRRFSRYNMDEYLELISGFGEQSSQLFSMLVERTMCTREYLNVDLNKIRMLAAARQREEKADLVSQVTIDEVVS